MNQFLVSIGGFLVRLVLGKHRTNCLFFASSLNKRRDARIKKAGKNEPLYRRRHYRSWRQSDSGWFPHFLYVEHLPHSGVRFISYKPLNRVDRKYPPLTFNGTVRWGDTPSEEHINER
jgi:hypothetical protein